MDKKREPDEHIISKRELAFQKEEKEKRASGLIITNIQRATEEKNKILPAV